MVPGRVRVDGRQVRFAVSDNERASGPEGPGSAPVWAVNVHGYFAGGGMYWRESAHLAEDLGWRVVNPCLPGFAGSDPLPWGEVSVAGLTDTVLAVLDHVGAGPVVASGHSMGGAVAVDLAARYPERTLGVIYRDGAGTPAWRRRRGLLVAALAPIDPDLAGVADLMAAVALDVPDLFVGRSLASTVRVLWPDARRNLVDPRRSWPVGSMLMELDLSREVVAVRRRGIPILPVWGCFDRVASASTAAEFAELSGQQVVWVPGGHSWMLPRPQGQADVLRHLEAGRRFVDRVLTRRRRLGRPDPSGAEPVGRSGRVGAAAG